MLYSVKKYICYVFFLKKGEMNPAVFIPYFRFKTAQIAIKMVSSNPVAHHKGKATLLRMQNKNAEGTE